jgi:hypothetical protein
MENNKKDDLIYNSLTEVLLRLGTLEKHLERKGILDKEEYFTELKMSAEAAAKLIINSKKS